MNHELQISLFEDDIKCTLQSILEFCELEFACIHSLSDNQPVLIYEEGSLKIERKTWTPMFDSLFKDGNLSFALGIKLTTWETRLSICGF